MNNFSLLRRVGTTALVAVVAVSCKVSTQPTQAAHSIEELRDQIEQHLGAPRFSPALWGVKVVAQDTGAVLFEQHADRLMSPASNSKLYAGALALDALGGEHRIVTPMLATARPDRKGRLKGDVIISGRGDPSWKLRPGGTNFWEIFEPFVGVLTNAGVRRITGDLVADATWFQSPPHGAGWTAGDLEETEGAEISALTLAENLTQLRVQPGASVGAPARLGLAQPKTGLTLDNRVVTMTNGGQAYIEVRRIFGESTLRVFGGLPPGTNMVVDVPVPRPAQWFAAALKEALGRRGIRVDGSARSVRWPEPSAVTTNLVLLGEISSPPMRDLVRAFMKPSQNLETDLVFAHVGEKLRTVNTPAWRTSEQLAVAALEAFIRTNGLPVDELKFEEGSGLSRNNLITANLTAGLLQVMARHRCADDFLAALPVAGVDGTLRRRMKGTAAEGNVRAKTGTLRWVNALSGHVTSAAGERLVFSLLLNRNVPAPGRSGREELDAIAVMLARFAGRSDTTLESLYAPQGTLIVTQFVSAPFPHPARAQGHNHRGQFYPAAEHYSDSTVAIFVPQTFQPAAPADLVVHFHGWNNSVAGTLGQFRLIEQLVASRRNAVLVVPAGPHHAPDSFGGKLEDAGGFKRFMTELTETLRSAGLQRASEPVVNRVILSGHSGGYHVISGILERAEAATQVDEVWLFDALYGGTENFLGWQQAQGGRWVNLFTDNGGTKAETERALGLLHQRGVNVLTGEHAQVTAAELQTNRVVFLHSDRSHSGVVLGRDAFQQLIETSGLQP